MVSSFRWSGKKKCRVSKESHTKKPSDDSKMKCVSTSVRKPAIERRLAVLSQVRLTGTPSLFYFISLGFETQATWLRANKGTLKKSPHTAETERNPSFQPSDYSQRQQKSKDSNKPAHTQKEGNEPHKRLTLQPYLETSACRSLTLKKKKNLRVQACA